MSGATLAIGRKFSASGFWDECRRYGATTFCYIGELLRYLLTQPEQANDRDHNVVKILGNGLRPDIWMAFKNRFGIDRVHEFYGASEGNSAFVNIFNFDKTCGWSPGSNKTWAVVEYDIAEDEVIRTPDGSMKKMAVGETGLLIMKVNEQYPFDGYTDQQASEKKLFRDVFDPAIAGLTAAILLRASHLATFNLPTGLVIRSGGREKTLQQRKSRVRWPTGPKPKMLSFTA